MPRKRRSFSATFKSKVAVDAIKGLKTVAEIAKLHQVHPSQVVLWKRQLLEGVESVFDGPTDRKDKAADQPQTAELYEQIGKLNMQLEWIKKKWPRTVSEKRKWIDWQHPELSVREQCRLLGLNRSNLYYEPVPETQENLQIMRMIDQEYMSHPCKGQRQINPNTCHPRMALSCHVKSFYSNRLSPFLSLVRRLLRGWVIRAY